MSLLLSTPTGYGRKSEGLLNLFVTLTVRGQEAPAYPFL